MNGIWKKVGYSVAGLTLVAVALLAYVLFVRLGYIEPDAKRELVSTAVSDQVDVYRDSYGVPHIFGQSTEDVLFATGYAMAEDRLTQLEMIRRTSRGELAAIFGPGLIEYDEWSRGQAYTNDELTEMLESMDEQERLAFLAMVNGINHYIAEAIANPDEKLPIEFDFFGIELQPYTPEDILSAIAMIMRKFGASGGTELTNQAFLQAMVEEHGAEKAQIIFDDILPVDDPDAVTISDGSSLPIDVTSVATAQELSPNALQAYAEVRDQTIFASEVMSRFGVSRGASRTIVIGPERSATGNALILQGTADGPEVHLKTPDFEFAGLTVPPMGLPVQGRNFNVGMVITTGERDTIDTFVVETDPDNPDRYLYRGDWHEMDIRVETIEVKDGEDVTIELAKTIHGPVILRDEESNLAYSQRWAMWMEEANVWGDLLRMIQSDSAEDYFAGLSNGFASNSNVSYADQEGSFGFRHTGNLPVRAPGVDPRLPMKGDGSEDWLGMNPHENNPGVHNPAKGYLHAWNNKPEPGITYADGTRWGKHFRTHLPLELILSKDKISIDDLKVFNRTISSSFYSIDLTLTTPRYFESYFREAAEFADDPSVARAAEQMVEWDGLFTDGNGDGYYDHPGAIIFRTWLPVAMETVFNDDIGDWWQRLDDDLYIPYQTSLLLRALEGEGAGLPMRFDYFNGESRAKVVSQSLVTTVTKLSRRFGNSNPDTWLEPVYRRYMTFEDARKGDEHVFQPRRGTGYSGGGVTLRYLPKSFVDNGAPEWLAIMEISPEESYYLSAIPSGGQSWFINTGWKASPHINDQYRLHEKLEFKTVHLDCDTIIAESESHLTIRPAN